MVSHPMIREIQLVCFSLLETLFPGVRCVILCVCVCGGDFKTKTIVNNSFICVTYLQIFDKYIIFSCQVTLCC